MLKTFLWGNVVNIKTFSYLCSVETNTLQENFYSDDYFYRKYRG